MAESKSEIEVQETEGDTKRPAFGTRYLLLENNVFQHNAWDNVEWDDKQEQEAIAKVNEQFANRMSVSSQEPYLQNASGYWNDFYGKHQNKFFKDRHWLFTEFPELSLDESSQNVSGMRNAESTSKSDKTQQHIIKDIESNEISVSRSDTSSQVQSATDRAVIETDDKMTKDPASIPLRILEVGCGVGNTVFPLLETNRHDGLMVYCCDFSQTAIDIVQKHEDYDCKRCHAFVCDISKNKVEFPFPDHSIDIIILIFVLSAIPPDKFSLVVSHLVRCLKPGGRLLFRDYGRYDMAQLRFKNERCMAENFYTRGDGTMVYFFTQDEVRQLFTSAGLLEEQNLIDRRLQVNRGRLLKMYRVWIQAKYTAPASFS